MLYRETFLRLYRRRLAAIQSRRRNTLKKVTPEASSGRWQGNLFCSSLAEKLWERLVVVYPKAPPLIGCAWFAG